MPAQQETTMPDKFRPLSSRVGADTRVRRDEIMDPPEETERWRQRRPPKEHPLVWHHRSGRKSLVVGMTVDHVVGMSDDASRALRS
jgi:hypothetical protein